MATERYRPGPASRCGVCPECGMNSMRQYGAKHSGVVHRYYYACQACQFEQRESIAVGTNFTEFGRGFVDSLLDPYILPAKF